MNIILYVELETLKVKEALKRVKSRKVVSPSGIPIKLWRYLERKGVKWLTDVFNKFGKPKRCQISERRVS